MNKTTTISTFLFSCLIAVSLGLVITVTMLSGKLDAANDSLNELEMRRAISNSIHVNVLIKQRAATEHWHMVANDLFSEWIYDSCGSHENANIHWDDMYFNCKTQ